VREHGLRVIEFTPPDKSLRVGPNLCARASKPRALAPGIVAGKITAAAKKAKVP